MNAFAARQERTSEEAKLSIALSALLDQRNELFAMPEEARPIDPRLLTTQIRELAETGICQMIDYAAGHDINSRDLSWISRKMLGFVRKGGWDMLETAEEIIQNAWIRMREEIPSEIHETLRILKQRKAQYQGKNGTHLNGKKPESLEEKRLRLKRKEENRAARLAAQPKKGGSQSVSNGFKNPGGKKKK